MKKIRKGVFETNSSSTHSICIAKEVEITIPESLHFVFGEFGWECDTLRSTSEKASYLYTGLIANSREDDAGKIFDILRNKGIKVVVDYSDETGYIDHSSNLNNFLDAVCEDECNLMSYLFSDLSFIITGNDNDETDVDINVSYPHDEYYKGN